MSLHTRSDEKTSVTNTVVVDATPERLWRSCTQIERWPRIFPTTKSVRRTEVAENEVMMDMTVENRLGVTEVRSHRRYDPAARRIDFQMLATPAAIARMDGSWAIEADGAGAKLVVVHDFAPAEGADRAEVAAQLSQNTDDVLAALKLWLDQDGDLAEDEAEEGLRDAWGPRNASNGISPRTFETCELFFSRLGLAGLDWGDITQVLKDLDKKSTHEDWADWHRRWTALGLHHEERSGNARAAKHWETARTADLKAAACHHYAEFFYFDDPAAKLASRDRVSEVFRAGLDLLPEAVRPLDTVVDGTPVPGYLITPRPNPGAAGPWPTVMLINGLDAAKEVELYAFARELVARGMAAVVFDAPGQGVHIGRLPMPVDIERYAAAVLEQAVAQPEVDADRLGIFGVSFGGYLAARIAAIVPGFKAFVNLSGGFDHDNYPDINAMVRKDFRFVFQQEDDEAMAELARTQLNLRGLPPLQIPVLAIHGELDTIIPLKACLRMLDWAQGPTELISYPGERHVATNFFGDFIPRFTDWLADRLGASI
jgi:alpha-beta hydrolase superfamily lysophospholipase/ribosome-associated toxin RatA of RatAB toxin-antitoxin module